MATEARHGARSRRDALQPFCSHWEQVVRSGHLAPSRTRMGQHVAIGIATDHSMTTRLKDDLHIVGDGRVTDHVRLVRVPVCDAVRLSPPALLKGGGKAVKGQGNGITCSERQ